MELHRAFFLWLHTYPQKIFVSSFFSLHVEYKMRMNHLFSGIRDSFLFFLLFSFLLQIVQWFLFFFFFSSVLRLIYVLLHGSVSSPLFYTFIFCYAVMSVGQREKQFVVVRYREDINMCRMNKWMNEREKHRTHGDHLNRVSSVFVSFNER
jgi:hypothetical protein